MKQNSQLAVRNLQFGTISSPSNQVILSPTSFNVNPGFGNYIFSLVPINGFLGGPITLHINGVDKDGVPCVTPFVVTVPGCEGQNGRLSEIEKTNNDFVIAPNPAINSVTFEYKNIIVQTDIAIYDLTGRCIKTYNITENSGSIVVDTSTYAAGVYVVLLRNNNEILLQKKLIIQK